MDTALTSSPAERQYQLLGSHLALDADVERVAALLAGRSWTVLTGAGLSTDSGIPDYRGPGAVRASPMLYAEFTGSTAAQQRYWARSYLGWRRIGEARPNAGHHALVDGEDSGLVGVVTQNVDGLHEAAGSTTVVDLHGRISDVLCLNCRRVVSRREVQDRLAALNPDVQHRGDPGQAELRPDGDAVVDSWTDFVLTSCDFCGGTLKPDVVFFGESVPKDRVERSYTLVDTADVLVVAGSSLTVMSGLRFVRHAARKGQPVVIINRGTTRGDEMATVKLDRGCSETLVALIRRLSARRRSSWNPEPGTRGSRLHDPGSR